MNKRIELNVIGYVQGVFYREFTLKTAKELGFKGFVKNLPDRTVQIVAEGPDELLEQLVRFAWLGPSRANVSNVIVSWHSFKNEFENFSFRF